MPIAREGARVICLASLILGACAGFAYWLAWPLAIPFVLVWLWVLSFFRDPKRGRTYEPGEICSAADGTVTEITRLDHYEPLAGPAIRIGAFMSLFNVHVNRSPCSGVVRELAYRSGKFLDARRPESGRLNESNTLLIDADPPMPGPIEVRQVAGMIARRIVCHAVVDEHMPIGHRFGIIKFGSRVEVIIPQRRGTEILVDVGDRVRGGLTILARQPVEAETDEPQASAYANSHEPQASACANSQ